MKDLHDHYINLGPQRVQKENDFKASIPLSIPLKCSFYSRSIVISVLLRFQDICSKNTTAPDHVSVGYNNNNNPPPFLMSNV